MFKLTDPFGSAPTQAPFAQSVSRGVPWHNLPVTREYTLGQLLDQTIARCGENDAVVYADRDFRLTWYEFGEEVDRLARGLMALGVKRGEKIALWATNVPHWVVLMFAAAKIGAILLPLNTNYKEHEMDFALAVRHGKPLHHLRLPRLLLRGRDLHARPRAARTAARRAEEREVPAPQARDVPRRREAPRHVLAQRGAVPRGGDAVGGLPRAPGRVRRKRRREHAVHERHHGLPEGRAATATSRTTASGSAPARTSPAATACASPCRCSTASAACSA